MTPDGRDDRTFGLIGAPTAAGAHSPGIEKAPSALRAAGLVPSLRAAGLAVRDHGDLPLEPFRLDRDHPRAQNAARVAAVAGDVSRVAGDALRSRQLPLVLGGDCTIVLGVLSAFAERAVSGEPEVGLVYVDAHPDLNTPDAVVQGALDWMGMAHALAVPGAIEELSSLGPRTPLLTWDRVAFFSFVDSEVTPAEHRLLEHYRPLRYEATLVKEDPAGRARLVASELGERAGALLVHFDVDVLDFAQVPIADNAYQRNQGLSLDEAVQALAAFAAQASFAGLVVTQVNPDHAVAEDNLLKTFAARLAEALSGAVS